MAQEQASRPAAPAPASPATDTLAARATDARVTLDGRLDEPAWASADSISDFRQREPVEGAPASQRTVVRVLRGADALYVSVRAYDRQPEALRAAQLRRDAELDSDDHVILLIDSFHDRRGAFLFATNPSGAMWDAQLAGSEEPNADWNGIWDVAVTRDAAGWTAEFRIPLRTLRFRAADDGVFGFNVRRMIRRDNEEDLWRSWARTEGLYQQLGQGELTGLGPLGRPRAIEIKPYVLGRLAEPEHDAVGTDVAAGATDGKAGFDAKLGITPTLTADLTVNTDFAQVEADQQVINLTRFPLFFPEKREFFLESSGVFDFGSAEQAQLFYSRRVGLDAQGAAVPILGGGRLYGKVGAWSLGLLGARTGGAEDATDVVLRVRRDVLERSTVGAMAVLRSAPGTGGVEEAAGVDARLPLLVRGQNVVPSLWIAATRTPATPGTAVAWRASVDYPNDLFDNLLALNRIDASFDPTLGFVQRTGVWGTSGHVSFRPRPGILGLRQLEIHFPIPEWEIYADGRGSLANPDDWQTARFEWQLLGGEFQTGDEFGIGFSRELDAPTDSFDLFPGTTVAPGRYWWNRLEANVETSWGRPVSVDAWFSWGDFYGGHSTALSGGATWRGGGHLILGADLEVTRATLPSGDFTALTAATHIEYAFDPRTTLMVFGQYNNEDRRADFYLRVHWIPTIGDDVYVVWNLGYSTDPASPYRFPRASALTRPLNGALIVKAAHRLAL